MLTASSPALAQVEPEPPPAPEQAVPAAPEQSAPPLAPALAPPPAPPLAPRPPALSSPAPASAALSLSSVAQPRAAAAIPLRRSPAFELDPAVDFAALGIGTAVTMGWLLGSELAPPWCAPQCDPASINPLDRAIAGTYDTNWKLASDVGIASLLVGSGLTLLLHDGLVEGLSDGVVVAQAVMFSEMTAVISNTSTRRPRPFMYGDDAPLSERMDGKSGLSFFSGHTAASFASVVVTARTLQKRGDGDKAAVVAAIGLPTASVVALGRVLSGYHFPTDVLAGAGVGTAFGFLMPALHAERARLVPLASAELQGVAWVGSF
jgi:membrane-associated phospholipid phosphatase